MADFRAAGEIEEGEREGKRRRGSALFWSQAGTAREWLLLLCGRERRQSGAEALRQGIEPFYRLAECRSCLGLLHSIISDIAIPLSSLVLCRLVRLN